MTRLLTTLLLWLLMAALPLHAVAASIQLSCAPTQRHLGAASVAAPAAVHSAQHAAQHHAAQQMAPRTAVQMADHAAHHPAPATAGQAPAHHGGQAAAGDDTPASCGADLSHSSCSACSVFCVGAVAPPSSLLSLPSFGGSEAVFIAPGELRAGFIPDGLQRPPRPSST